jgi:uroporphyrinogen-III synthase
VKPVRPLAGRRVVVTRASEQAGDLVERLIVLGAEPVEVPLIEIIDPPDGGAALSDAVNGAVDWIVVTSANGAERVLAALPDGAPSRVRFAVVGPMTATVLERGGVEPALIPPRFVAESLVEAFPRGHGVVVVAQAAGARRVVADGIAAKGWDVRVVEAYRTAALAPPSEALEAARDSDAILFTSASTVSSFVSAAGVDGVPPVVVCIGPVTAEAAIDLGLKVTSVPDEHTIPAMVAVLVEVLRP